jgi:bifunctional non-homologous end joining protein LigD
MLSTLLREPLGDDYVYELKLDGYRVEGGVSKASITLSSRSGLNYTAKYPHIATALKKLTIR